MIIGIDGGGTKTTGIVVNEQGNILAKEMVGPTNPNSSNYELVKNELETLFSSFHLKKALTFDDVVFAGISGVESGGKKEWFSALLREIIGDEPEVIIDNDAITALYSETKGKPGIVSISGTGSISFGINEDNERARVGGWGYLIQDESSGFSIGKRVLDHVFEQHDKGKEPCELSSAVMKHFMVKEIPNIVPHVYELGTTRDRIASLGSVAVSFSNKGDKLCTSILEEAANGMLKEIATLYEKLNQGKRKNDSVPIVLTGGIIQHATVMLAYLEQKAKQRGLPFQFILPSMPPIAGTIYAAIKNSKNGLKVTPTFSKVLEEELRIQTRISKEDGYT
ncbi:N-acetylglucosamine kinase [Sutcliffiella halmapala]|uniref:N-acetylglucosamine kinase n=1 Tax=Sutcliffiella halmapala TaxID=79882 RepID=UPI001475429E|nr:BadF/BadG/BcrA/BcrD ATPase family protein [Sutcliffiella halmapala]